MTKRHALYSWILLLSLSARGSLAAGDETYLAPMDLLERVKAARASHSAFDIGDLHAVFDGDLQSLARTPAVNPLEIELHFEAPVRAHGIRLTFNRELHKVLLEGAAEPGAERKTLAAARTEPVGSGRGGVFHVRFQQPLTLRSWYLTARRLTGDDYVHLYEWEFLEPGEPGRLRITCSDGAEFLTCLKTDPLPEDHAHPCRLRLRALLEHEGRKAREVTEECRWAADPGGALEPMKEAGGFLSRKAGPSRVRARFMDQEAVYEVALRERVLENLVPDLDVAFIERFPKYDYDGPKGWPAPGDRVAFRAALIWWGAEAAEEVAYRWRLDGAVVKEGVIPRIDPAGSRVQVEMAWTWEPGRHVVGFEADPEGEVEELTEDNNAVTDFTDALTVGFWVDQKVYDHVHEHRHRMAGRGNSFDDWAQDLMRRWNDIFAAAEFPSCPEGVLDRVRLDKVVVVPTDALPLNGGIPTNNPDTRDKTVDLMWGFPSRDFRNGAWSLESEGWWKEDLGVLHELGHARYLVDAYGFDVHAKYIQILDDEGRPVVGTRYMKDGISHWRKYGGQMGGDYGRLSEYDALCWNLKAGQRAKGSPCNAPPDIGSFLQLMPGENLFTFTEEEGKPLAGARLRVYRAEGNGTDWYGKVYDNTPDLDVTLDKDGSVVFGKNLFGERIIHTYGHSNGVVIFRVDHEGRTAYLFQEVTDFNLSYMRGEEKRARYRRVVSFPAAGEG